MFHAGFAGFGGGFAGVDVFFVISGFLITAGILEGLESGAFSLLVFYRRRAQRILPALFVVLLACLPAAWAWLLPTDMKRFCESLVGLSAFASNVMFALTGGGGYFGTATEMMPLLHTWSLSVEEQFYALLPVLLVLAWRLGPRGVRILVPALFALSLVAALRGVAAGDSKAFYLLPSRAWELLGGALLALAPGRGRVGSAPAWLREVGTAAGLAMIVGAVAVFDSRTPFAGGRAMLPFAGTLLVLACGERSLLARRVLGHRFPVGIGRISYSAYLWHQPLFAFARHRQVAEPGPLLMAVLAAASLGLGYLTWRWVETPARRRDAFTGRQALAWGLGGSLLFASVGLSGFVTQGFPRRFDAPTRAIAAIDTMQLAHRVQACWASARRAGSFAHPCRIGAAGAAPSFAVLGDSHAAVLLAPLDAAARRTGLAGLDDTLGACPPLEGVDPSPMNAPRLACQRLRKDLFAHRLGEDGDAPHTLVVSAFWSQYVEGEPFDNGEGGSAKGALVLWGAGRTDEERADAVAHAITGSIRRMLAGGRRVILVYPVPEVGWGVPQRLARIHVITGHVEAADGSTDYRRYLDRARRATAALDAVGDSPNLVRIRPAAFLCDRAVPGRCIVQQGGRPLYLDDNHLSAEGTRPLVEEIMKQLLDGAAPAAP